MPQGEPRSMHVVVDGRIRAPVERVFPLCCPVEEYRWIEGWKCDLVHCPNDRVEEGTVFREILSAPWLQRSIRAPTTWTAVLHDPATHRVRFELVNGCSKSLYEIALKDAGDGETATTLDFTFVARNARGNRLVERDGEARLRAMLGILHEMLRHYCETGRMLGQRGLARLVVTAEGLTAADRLRLASNRLAMALASDPDRERLLARLGSGDP